ncbi:hypothetical protein Prudu_014479 [Prunus dulcis]|uniref:Uncharacterized protein n=1 Tax=Prunus dulcis TaxID=3755 RepID=A0A4Y1RHM0_PRUDU|nr:hypothetical protein Prudu_014479 [Prunus dulcis]
MSEIYKHVAGPASPKESQWSSNWASQPFFVGLDDLIVEIESYACTRRELIMSSKREKRHQNRTANALKEAVRKKSGCVVSSWNREMWFGGGAFRASTSTGSGLITSATAFVRHFSRKRAENLRKINPKVSFPEANSIARDLYDVVKQHGPLTISNTWVQAKGFWSQWIEQQNTHEDNAKMDEGKEDAEAVPQPNPEVTEFRTSSAVKVQNRKPSVKRKKQKK